MDAPRLYDVRQAGVLAMQLTPDNVESVVKFVLEHSHFEPEYNKSVRAVGGVPKTLTVRSSAYSPMTARLWDWILWDGEDFSIMTHLEFTGQYQEVEE